MVVSIFLLALDEIPTAKVRGRVVEVRVRGEFEQVVVVEQDAVLAAPRTRIDALEGEGGVELTDRLTARMHLDASAVGHECCRAQSGQSLSVEAVPTNP